MFVCSPFVFSGRNKETQRQTQTKCGRVFVCSPFVCSGRNKETQRQTQTKCGLVFVCSGRNKETQRPEPNKIGGGGVCSCVRHLHEHVHTVNVIYIQRIIESSYLVFIR